MRFTFVLQYIHYFPYPITTLTLFTSLLSSLQIGISFFGPSNKLDFILFLRKPVNDTVLSIAVFRLEASYSVCKKKHWNVAGSYYSKYGPGTSCLSHLGANSQILPQNYFIRICRTFSRCFINFYMCIFFLYNRKH